MNYYKVFDTIGAVAIAVSLSACSQTNQPDVDSLRPTFDTPTATTTPPVVTPTNRATRAWITEPSEMYTSISDLSSQADLVIAATPTDDATVQESNPPRTTRVVLVDSIIKGKELERVRVIETGDGKEPYSIEAGKHYVLFLQRIDNDANQEDYLIVGSTQGAYEVGTDGVTNPADPEMKQLPKDIPLEDLLNLK